MLSFVPDSWVEPLSVEMTSKSSHFYFWTQTVDTEIKSAQFNSKITSPCHCFLVCFLLNHSLALDIETLLSFVKMLHKSQYPTALSFIFFCEFLCMKNSNTICVVFYLSIQLAVHNHEKQCYLPVVLSTTKEYCLRCSPSWANVVKSC